MLFDKTYTGQFLISPHGSSLRASARLTQLASTNLQVFPGIDSVEVQDSQGTLLGVLLGTVVDMELEKVVTGAICLPVNMKDELDWDRVVEDHIYRFSGAFVFLLDTGELRRIYLDADGCLSLVFDPDTKTAATTTGLLLNDEEYAALEAAGRV